MQVAANRSGVCTRLLDGGSHADPAPDFPLGHGSRVFVDSGIFAASVVARYRPQGCKKSKKQAKKAAKELGYTRKDWLEQDVIYIITPGEREAFLKLGTNEERDQFMDTFWRNRNPDPDSPENSFKEEHYRRIAYANEHFASGVQGWRTDRGHIYILWGPPDELESHPTGGTYDRPIWQGGGSTTT